jgi:2-amino-4-hydroxy-6-hydroxymethyldihydropteridine diphosphokinase
MDNVFLLLGSNLGDAQSNLNKAINAIEALGGKIISSSSVYVTKAWGKLDQPDFLNQIVQIFYEDDANVLLKHLLDIELSLGRTRQQKWDARTIDIDILFFGDKIIAIEGLTVPHPQIPFRRFTLTPMAEVAPGFIHPALHKTMVQLLEECTDTLAVRKMIKN